jgi:branched-chain amino acid aminotransferase
MPDENSLGFGKYFTDHMFVANYSPEKKWHDLSIVPYGPITLDPAASVLHYGQSLFEGMKAFQHSSGKIALFRPRENYLRLLKGAEAVCLEAPPEELFLTGIKELIQVDKRWVPKTENCSLYIRPFLFGTEAFLGVRPSQLYKFMVILSPVGNYYSEGDKPIKIWIEDRYVRAAPGGLGSVKAGANYAASLRATVIAKEKGYAQVLWLDSQHKYVEEVGTMNIFFVFKDEIVTPELNGSILAGVTRDTVIDLLLQKSLPIKERKISIDELLEKIQKQELLEAFGTGTAAVISPIGSFRYLGKDYTIPTKEQRPEPLSSQLKNQIRQIQRGDIASPKGWVELID